MDTFEFGSACFLYSGYLVSRADELCPYTDSGSRFSQMGEISEIERYQCVFSKFASDDDKKCQIYAEADDEKSFSQLVPISLSCKKVQCDTGLQQSIVNHQINTCCLKTMKYVSSLSSHKSGLFASKQLKQYEANTTEDCNSHFKGKTDSLKKYDQSNSVKLDDYGENDSIVHDCEESDHRREYCDISGRDPIWTQGQGVSLDQLSLI